MDVTDGAAYLDPNDDYDPHEHRSVKKPTNNWQTYANFLKALIGVGVLAMPNAFSNSGYVNGCIFTVIVGIIVTYCLHLLIGSMYVLCKRRRVPYLSYSEAMTIGFQEGPPYFRFLAPMTTPFVDGFLAFYQYGNCCTYYVFITTNIKQLVDEYVCVIDIRIHMCIMFIPLVLIYSIRNLKSLAIYSTIANGILIVGLSVIMYYAFQDMPPLSERNATVHYSRLPLYLGTVLFALEAVGVVLAIEENMKTPKAYVTPFGIMNMATAFTVVLYIFIGFFGYWKYGDESLGSITLNIPQKEVLSQLIKGLYATAIYISYPLQGYVTADIIWNKYLSKRVEDTSKHVRYELIIRTIFVCFTFVAAVVIPNLAIFNSLVGSFCLSILGIIFPAVLQICVKYRTGYGPFKSHLIKNLLLVSFGLLGGIVDDYGRLCASLKQLIIL